MKNGNNDRIPSGIYDSLDDEMIRSLDSESTGIDSDAVQDRHLREKAAYKVLHRRSHETGARRLRRGYGIIAAFFCIALITVLVYACCNMPVFGADAALTDNEVSRFYVEEGLKHTGATNIVTSIIMEFRGFDTLGESHVLFIAASMVIMLLYTPKANRAILSADSVDRHFEPTHDEVLKHCARLVMPFIAVFAIYVLLNGHLSPGGGFSGGAVLGAGLILVFEAFGPKPVDKYITFSLLRRLMTCALMFYALSKAYIFFTGVNGIENGLSTGTFGRIFSGGLLMPINLAVGTVVACTMYVLYSLLRRKGELN